MASFNYIKEREWKKLQGWEGKLLSQAGREVLIKAMIQAIPTYTMGCFKIPLGLCHDIEALIKKYFWGQKGDQRKIHWVKWGELTKSKMVDGMGFKDLALHNDSLLARQSWHLLHNKTSPFYKVFKARFFPNCSIMEAIDSRSGSYAWRSILMGKEVIQRGARWWVGNGRTIKLWQHGWIPRKHSSLVASYQIESMAD
ncbi:putative mitochondrial protein AtMg00310 [Castanea sativa]|uniref:putative mitochondrial protein AtMg00310 n=1 Tax=Castanea sativa TaxID=21020 RepID=UPI003F64D8EF